MKPRVLILWNQVEEDIYEQWRQQGPRPLAWDPERAAPDVGTVAEEMASIIEAVRSTGYRVDVVNVEDDLERLIASIRLYRPDVIMNLVEYFNDDSSQEAHVAALYELMGVAYTGSEPMPLTLCQNKYRTKLLLEAAGLPTSPYMLVDQGPVPNDHELTFPLIVKPALEDASGGIEPASVVRDQAALEARVEQVRREYRMPVLVEQYVEGREIHAALLGNDPPEVLPLFEMEFDDTEFNLEGEWRPQIISYRAKWDPNSPDFYAMDSVCPAEDLDEETEEYIRDIAAQAFAAVGCRDYARIDMRLDEEEGEVYILEVNPNPDLADGAAYMQCATASGRSFAQTIRELVDMAWQRVCRARAAERADEAAAAAGAADLPSDHLMREWVLQQRSGSRAPVPMMGGVGGDAGGAGAAGAAGAAGDEAASGDGTVTKAGAERLVGGVDEGGGD